MKKRTRKTVEVKKIKDRINKYLERNTLNQDEKKALCMFLEELLHSTGNYNGYNFLSWMNGGCDQWIKDGRPIDNRKYAEPEYDRFYY